MKKMTRHIGLGAVLAVAILFTGAPQAGAATLGELSATTAIQGELSSGSTGPGVGYLDRSRQSLEQSQQIQGLPGAPTQGMAAPAGMPMVDPAMQGMPGVPGFPEEPKITVISGTRVFDAITGQLLDDAVQRQVPQSQAENYEMVDGQYLLVSTRNDVIGQSNQRIKERLVRALTTADQFTPLEFFGVPIATTQQSQAQPRNRAWTFRRDQNGGPGMVLTERPVEDPLVLPHYRAKQKEKDERIRNDWALRFLQDFRTEKDSLASQFYSLHVPQPPLPPAVEPLPLAVWQPFSDPSAMMDNRGQGGMGEEMFGEDMGLGGGFGGVGAEM